MAVFYVIRRREDVRTVAWPFLLFGLTRACWELDTWAGVPLLMYFSFACAAIAHNSMHCRVFCSDLAEEVWRVLLSLSYGHPVNTFVPGHNLSHHVHMQQPEDLMHTHQMRFRWPQLNFLLFQPTVAPKVFRQDLQYMLASWRKARGRGLWCRYTVTTCVQAGVVLGVQGWLLWLHTWHAIVLWWVPRIFAQWAIVTMNLLQHDNTSDDERTFNFARNFVSWRLNFFMFNNGYHTIHHRMPNVHWSQYPQLHRRIIKHEIRPDLDEPSMLAYIWRTYVWAGPLA